LLLFVNFVFQYLIKLIMRKLILLAVTFTAMFATFQSCRKEIKNNSESVHDGDLPAKLEHCTLSVINEWSYSSLGTKLCGIIDGIGTVGALDNKLNCQVFAGGPCNPVVNGNSVIVTELTPTGWHVLSDGVMSVTEQETLINYIKNACNSHALSTFGTGYQVFHYDVWYVTPLCGGCSGITIMVNYKAAQPCRTK